MKTKAEKKEQFGLKVVRRESQELHSRLDQMACHRKALFEQCKDTHT